MLLGHRSLRTLSTQQPFAVQVPSSYAEKAAGGYSLFHCYAYTFMFSLESWLYLDNLHGVETAAVVFGSAPWLVCASSACASGVLLLAEL